MNRSGIYRGSRCLAILALVMLQMHVMLGCCFVHHTHTHTGHDAACAETVCCSAASADSAVHAPDGDDEDFCHVTVLPTAPQRLEPHVDFLCALTTLMVSAPDLVSFFSNEDEISIYASSCENPIFLRCHSFLI